MFLILFTLLSPTFSSDSTCEVLDINMCKFTNYTLVRLPNELGQKTQTDASLELDHFKSLISTNCSADLQLFLCTLYAPICDSEKGPDFHIKPCRTMCLNVRDRCLPIMKNNSFDWPNSFKCGRFPVNDICVKGTESMTTDPPPTKPKPKTTPRSKEVTAKPPVWIEPNNRCRQDQFYCDNTCIPLQFRCDDVIDCKEDHLDEKNCDKCLTNQFRCESGEKCIAALNKCDSFDDCEDGSDEKDCGLCSGSEFQCDKDRCIPRSLLCNNHINCADGSDEKQCGKCPSNSYTCNNGRCISEQALCDGQDDCGDNSDETDASCYDIQPTKQKPDYCANFFQKCEFQDSCANALTNYRAQCDAIINGHSQTQCTRQCQTAYYGLKSTDPVGIGMIKMQCEQIHAKKVEDKCIRNPPTHNCLDEVTNCQKTKRCAHLYSMYNTHCENTLNNHDQCSAGCSNSYSSLVADPTAAGLVRECIEISDTIKIACTAQELRSTSYKQQYSTLFILIILSISLI